MPVTIKLEKVVDENPDNDFQDLDCVSINSYNNLQCQNENLHLLLSISKETCSDQESKLIDLKFQIDEMQNSISNLEKQILTLKQENEKSSDIISEKYKIFDILYDTVGNLDSRNNYSVSDPKSAMMKLNDYQQTMKELRNQVIDNKILIMTMCKILGCVDTKIIQSLKDIISENEVHKQKYKIYEQFYKNSQKTMDQTSLELHRNGYDKSVDNNSNPNSCSIHRESFDNWNQKMTNLLYNSAGKIEKSSGKSPTIKRENYSNQKPNFLFIPTDFYRQVPPPQLRFGGAQPPLPGLCGLNAAYPVEGPPAAASFQMDTRSTHGRPNRVSQHNSSSSNSINEIHPMNDNNTSSAFEINSNVFDWKNCVSPEAKMELMKLEQKLLVPTSSNKETNLSPSLTLVEDGLEIWSSDSDSDSTAPKRPKLRINYM